MHLKWFFVALVGYSWFLKSLHAAPPRNNVLHLEPAGVVRVGKQPKQIGVAPNGKKAYVTNFGEKSVDVLDLSTFRVHRRIHTGGAPVEVAFTPNSRYTFITNFSPGALWQIDTYTDQSHTALSPDGKIVYASNTGSATIAALDAKTGRILRRIRVGAWPKTIDVTRDGRWLFSANYAGRSLSIVDLQHGRESTRLPMPDRLSGLALSPNNQHLYATGWDTGRVWRWRLVLPKK